MTLLVSWTGVDCKPRGNKIASLYFASDSRFTWKFNSYDDHCQKLFGCRNSPEIFALCGDVNFPKSVINKIITQIDNENIFCKGFSFNNKLECLSEIILEHYNNYDKNKIVQPFTILYGSRIDYYEFHLAKFEGSKTKPMSYSEIHLGDGADSNSDVCHVSGSGKSDFLNRWKFQYDISKNNNFRTSRTVYHCLSETLGTTNDNYVGPIPQIIGLYRKGNSRIFGTIIDGERYVLGKKVSKDDFDMNSVEWRNELFERIKPEENTLIDGAQRQPSDMYMKQLPDSPLIDIT